MDLVLQALEEGLDLPPCRTALSGESCSDLDQETDARIQSSSFKDVQLDIRQKHAASQMGLVAGAVYGIWSMNGDDTSISRVEFSVDRDKLLKLKWQQTHRSPGVGSPFVDRLQSSLPIARENLPSYSDAASQDNDLVLVDRVSSKCNATVRDHGNLLLAHLYATKLVY